MFWRSHRAVAEDTPVISSGKILLLLGLHSSGVKTMIVNLHKGEIRVLSVAERVFEQAQFITNHLVDVAGMYNAVHLACKEAMRIARVTPQQFIVSVSGTIVTSGSRTLNFRREDANKKLDTAELTHIVQKLEEEAIAKDQKRFSVQYGLQAKELKLLHASLIKVKLDGKITENPLGVPARYVECTFYNSFVRSNHEGILKTLAAELDMELLGVVPDLVGTASLLPHISPAISDAFIVDVGAAATTVGLHKNGALQDSVAFNIGGCSFTKRIMFDLHVSFADAQKIKHAYSDALLEKHSADTVYHALKGDIQLWIDALQHSVQQLIDLNKIAEDAVPTTIVLTGGSSTLPELTQALLSVAWQQDLPLTERAKIEHITLKRVLLPFVKKQQLITDHRYIPLLGLGILGRDFIAQQSLLQSVLQKALKLLSV